MFRENAYVYHERALRLKTAIVCMTIDVAYAKCCCSAGGPVPQMGPHHTGTQETALASREATHSLHNSATDVSCASLHN